MLMANTYDGSICDVVRSDLKRHNFLLDHHFLLPTGFQLRGLSLHYFRSTNFKPRFSVGHVKVLYQGNIT